MAQRHALHVERTARGYQVAVSMGLQLKCRYSEAATLDNFKKLPVVEAYLTQRICESVLVSQVSQHPHKIVNLIF